MFTNGNVKLNEHKMSFSGRLSDDKRLARTDGYADACRPKSSAKHTHESVLERAKLVDNLRYRLLMMERANTRLSIKCF